jgi:imidazole glycerol-phosphate synthase subunit HisF
MSRKRIIARLDVKGPNLIKGVQLEGLRKVGEPNEYALQYYQNGIDEMIFMDSVASLYGRNHLAQIIEQATNDVFIPLTVGGGIRSEENVADVLRSGADKIAINTAAVQRPNLIAEISNKFGGQCVVLSIEAKRSDNGSWEVYTDNGRERTGLDVKDWINRANEHGIGEILITSVDQEGTQKGFDYKLLELVGSIAVCPVIASGGAGSPEHVGKALSIDGIDAVALAHILHYQKYTVSEIKSHVKKVGLDVR